MRAITIAALAMLAAAPVQADCDPPGSFRLYRSSSAMTDARIHVATFDAPHGREYNLGNCTISAKLRMAQPGVLVHYWCEPVG